MNDQTQSENEQSELWNSFKGQNWVEMQPLLDSMFEPLRDRLMDELRARGASKVLDIGCGTGDTTLAAARTVAEGGVCVGADIAQPMLSFARLRAKEEDSIATFVEADAETYAFKEAYFDLVMSRFGVMFFSDFVAAFSNMRRAMAPGGSLCFISWRPKEDNPLMTLTEEVALQFFPDFPQRQNDEPGQFGLSSPERTRRFLEDAGWKNVAIDPIDDANDVSA